jgi:hypothetical protein
MVWGGQASVCTALFVAALCGHRWNPVLKVFYDRSRAAGKPKQVALIACARKLLTILNAMVRDRAPWVTRASSVQYSCYRIAPKLRLAAAADKNDAFLTKRPPRADSFKRSLCENMVLSTPKLLIFHAATSAKVAFSHRLSAG